MSSNKDNIYADQHQNIGDFSFDKNVVNVFTDMIGRSVPGYQEIVSLTSTITKLYQRNNHNYYDLGCSLGAGMQAMGQSLEVNSAKVIGIDNSADMINKAQAIFEGFSDTEKNVSYVFHCANIKQINIEKAAMVLMNFTLQFIALEERPETIQAIHDGLVEGGVLLLSEKIKFEDTKTQALLTDIHHQFKADQGYSELEISQKRDAIENVLLPETMDTHIDRLKKAGFSTVTPWFQNFQFVSFLAIK